MFNKKELKEKELPEKKEKKNFRLHPNLGLDLKGIKNKSPKFNSTPSSPTNPQEESFRLTTSASSIIHSDYKLITESLVSPSFSDRMKQFLSEQTAVSPRGSLLFGIKRNSPKSYWKLVDSQHYLKNVLSTLQTNPTIRGKHLKYNSNASSEPLEFLTVRPHDAVGFDVYYLDKSKLLGSGAQGKVYLAYNLEEETPVAIKSIELKPSFNQRDIETEISNLISKKEFIGYCQSDDLKFGYILMNYHRGQSLRSYLYQEGEHKDKDEPDYFIKKINHNPFKQVRLIRLVIMNEIAFDEPTSKMGASI